MKGRLNRRYPTFYEKIIPVALVLVGLLVVTLLVITVSVALGWLGT